MQRLDDFSEKLFLNELNEKLKTIYLVGTATGLRVSDIVTLKKNILSIKEPTIKEQKTGKSKRIYIPVKIRKRLYNIAANSHNEYIFFSASSQSGHISRQYVWKTFKKVAKKLDIKINMGTQSMRKKYAKRLYDKHNLNYVKNKLNHDSVITSLIYCMDDIKE